MFYPKLKILKKSRLYTIYCSDLEFVMHLPFSSGNYLKEPRVKPDPDPLGGLGYADE